MHISGGQNPSLQLLAHHGWAPGREANSPMALQPSVGGAAVAGRPVDGRWVGRAVSFVAGFVEDLGGRVGPGVGVMPPAPSAWMAMSEQA